MQHSDSMQLYLFLRPIYSLVNKTVTPTICDYSTAEQYIGCHSLDRFSLVMREFS